MKTVHVKTRLPSAQSILFNSIREIALSMSGSLTKDMFDKQEVRNWTITFLSGVEIPPLVFFPASEGFVDTKKGKMTEDAFAAVVFPHIKKYNPGSRVVVFDSATSHVTPKCRQSVNDFGI
jgi:hypothetical protein